MSYLYFIVILNLILRCAGFRKSCSTCPKGFFFLESIQFNFILFIHHQITTTVARGRPYNNTTEKTPTIIRPPISKRQWKRNTPF